MSPEPSHVGLMQFDDIVRLFCRNETENRGSLKQPFQPTLTPP